MYNKIILKDCITGIKELPDESINMVFADPPFNIGYKYNSYNDSRENEEYLKWCDEWISECVRVLKPNGAFYLAIGDEYAAELNILLKKNKLFFRNWIIWYYTFGQNCKKKFNRTHTHIHYFVKNSKNFVFNTDSVRVPSMRQLKYKDKRANSKGKVPDDVWQMSRVCGTFKERLGNHPCQMPEEVLERIIKVSTSPGDLVLDPFCGSGTTSAVCKKLNRDFITYEIDEKYYENAKKRIENITLQKEKTNER